MKKTFVTLGIISCLLAGCQNKQQETTPMCEQQENQVVATIMARRSIRKYKPQPVERAKMDEILKCGINAPNGQNKQSWEVRVVDNPVFMAEIKDAMAKGHPDMDPEMIKGCFRGAPTMVFIARARSYDFSAYDCGLMAENMMLAAQSLGLGTVCMGSPIAFLTQPAGAEFLSSLSFSEGYEPLICIGIGYADEAPAAKPRNKDVIKYIE